MRVIARHAAFAALGLMLGAAGPADSPVNVPEPEGLYTGPPKGYTPSTLKGATVIDLKGLEKLLPEGPVLIDVVLAYRRPEGLPADRPWLPTHRSLPGAIWMPGAGGAPLAPEKEEAFLRRVAELTGGDRAKQPVGDVHPARPGQARRDLLPAGMLGELERRQAAGRGRLQPRPLVPPRRRGLAGRPRHRRRQARSGLDARGQRARPPALSM